jgi:transcriptional regulator with XRE-family HTH domain
MTGWQLSVSDVARLFGVTRQAVQQWLEGGVPPARQPTLLQILRIADLLQGNLQSSRIPAVVRSDAAAYGGRSMLELIADGRHDELLGSVERSFDWASTA